jgi:hypothetical protein
MIRRKKNIFCLILLASQTVDAITLVYNIKLRRTFNVDLSAFIGKKKVFWLLTAAPIVYKRDRHIIDENLGIDVEDKRIIGGTLLNLRFVPNRNWWAEVSTGIEHEHLNARGSSEFTASRTAFDDIVFSGGRNFFLGKKGQCVLYGLFGVPTKWDVSPFELHDTLVGTRFFGAGVGSELSYSWFMSLKRDFITFLQVRFLHFFSREWEPILPAGSKIQPGNVTDVLLAARYREKLNLFEIGYNPTIFTNQAIIVNNRKTDGPHIVRQGVYFSVYHAILKMPLIEKPGLIGTGILINRAKRFDTKIFGWWINISAVF